MDFHTWKYLSPDSRVCTGCDRHEIRYGNYDNHYWYVRREGRKNFCTLKGHIIRWWAGRKHAR